MKYDYGEAIRISAKAPECYSPCAKGSLCGVRHVETESQAKAANVSVGTVLWLVEFGDGSSVEVPEDYLTPLDQH